MAGADDLAARCRASARKPDVESGRQNDEPRGDLFAIRQLDGLPLWAGRNVGDLGVDELGALGNLRTHGVDQRVVENAALRRLAACRRRRPKRATQHS